MPSFREKLDRLGAGAAKVGPPRHAKQPQPREPEPPREPERSGVDLAELGRRIASMVGEAAETSAPDERASSAEAVQLPFEREGASEPPRWVRRLTFDPSHAVGQVALGAALGADRATLALLALTPELAGAALGRAIYLDTETTGLGGAGTIAFLVGLCWYDAPSGRFVLEQRFLRDPAEEPGLLAPVAEQLGQAELCVSYNGKSFDLPVLRTRLVLHRRAELRELPHVDLLHLVRRVHRHRRWRKNLGSAELHVLGYDRGPDVAGDQVAQRYHHFLRSGDAAGLLEVVEHNVRDVLSLVALVGLYGEPLQRLGAEDLAGVARALYRAGDAEQAMAMAQHAVGRGGGAPALRVRAEIAKARGDKQQALSDFEALAREVDDPTVRLELAKLYEHHVRSPRQALEQTELGIAEKPAAVARRRERLERKIRGRRGPAEG